MSSESGFSLPKSAATEMVDNFFKGDRKNLKTVYTENFNGGESLIDKSATAIREFSDDMSPAMKRMQSAYLTAVQENCYQAHHISDDFTNEQQIQLCKNETYDSIWGSFNQHYKNHRESDLLRLNRCNTDAGQDAVETIQCFMKYSSDIRDTNKTLKQIFSQENKEYL